MKISVCIPATRAASLDRAIHSLLAQTWGEWEVVVLGQGDGAAEAAMRAAMSKGSGERSTMRKAICETAL